MNYWTSPDHYDPDPLEPKACAYCGIVHIRGNLIDYDGDLICVGCRDGVLETNKEVQHG